MQAQTADRIQIPRPRGDTAPTRRDRLAKGACKTTDIPAPDPSA